MQEGIYYSGRPKVKDSARVLHDIEYRPNYGVICPSSLTTNGDASVIRNNIEPEYLPEFDTWLSNLPK